MFRFCQCNRDLYLGQPASYLERKLQPLHDRILAKVKAEYVRVFRPYYSGSSVALVVNCYPEEQLPAEYTTKSIEALVATRKSLTCHAKPRSGAGIWLGHYIGWLSKLGSLFGYPKY